MMAICVVNKAENNPSVSDAVQWLAKNGFDRKAQKLNAHLSKSEE